MDPNFRMAVVAGSPKLDLPQLIRTTRIGRAGGRSGERWGPWIDGKKKQTLKEEI